MLPECRCQRPRDPDSDLILLNDSAPIKGGDRLLLRSGYHGHVNLNTFIFTDWLTIAAQDGQTPVLSRIRFEGAFAKIYFKGLTLLKDSYEGPGNYWQADEINHNNNACLYLTSSGFWGVGRQVKVNNLTVKTTRDASSWTAADWVQRAAGGISLSSVLDCEIVNCHIENIRHGLLIEYASDNTIAVNNTIKYYSGDGCRLISNNVFLAYNTITDCLKVDGNHDNTIQNHDNDTCPWIMVTDHKNGTPSENCTVANNIVYRSISASGNDVSEHNNYIVDRNNASQLYDLFVSPDDLDFHLQDNTLTRQNIIDQGEVFTEMISSQLDRDHVERTGAQDLGAYEFE